MRVLAASALMCTSLDPLSESSSGALLVTVTSVIFVTYEDVPRVCMKEAFVVVDSATEGVEPEPDWSVHLEKTDSKRPGNK